MNFASEVLILCGAYFMITNHGYGALFIFLGICGAIIRFGVTVARAKVKDDFMETLHKITKDIAVVNRDERPECSREKHKSTIH